MYGVDGYGQHRRAMSEPGKLIPTHGGYRKLKSFQVAQLACRCHRARLRSLHREAQPHPRSDVQAARSGVQNIAEVARPAGPPGKPTSSSPTSRPSGVNEDTRRVPRSGMRLEVMIITLLPPPTSRDLTAVRSAAEQIIVQQQAGKPPRILLNLATDSGKTRIAAALLRKLVDAGLVQKAPRDALRLTTMSRPNPQTRSRRRTLRWPVLGERVSSLIANVRRIRC
jgi:hypothetical protein